MRLVRDDRPALFPRPDDAQVSALAACQPERVARTVEVAERCLRHEFALLGSEPFAPRDPDRPTRDAYRPIDWRLDPVRGLRFPGGFHHSTWNFATMRPGNADIKLPWELGRCQHWPLLAQAWRLTGDRRLALEIFAQREDFDDANPVGTGVQWICTMDVAIRAANWALAFDMLRGFDAAATQWHAAYASLLSHGRFIRANLEDKYEVTSNHFLSNVVGLLYVARVLGPLPETAAWEAFCRRAIEREMSVQVLPDGADFESSMAYHRLVTELFLGAACVGAVAGKPFSANFHDRLRDMVEFQFATLRPDGCMPQIGDADDGRLHILTDYGSWSPQDAQHLLGAAAGVLSEPRWRRHAGDRGNWEAFWWSGGACVEGFSAEPLPAVAKLFPDSGIAVVRDAATYLVITNGAVGTRGFGNHKHNELLSFEYHSGGVPWVTDPGSFVYTSDPDARNVFRSTAYHSTLQIDGAEQNEVNPEWLFRMFEKAAPEHFLFSADERRACYHGQHRGYARLASPVTHERRFELDRHSGTLSIEDTLRGGGSHLLVWRFRLAPGVRVTEDGPLRVKLRRTDANIACALGHPPGLDRGIIEGWYSPSYGVREHAVAIELSCHVTLPGEQRWAFRFSLE
jgi:hypothetical protein